MAGCDFGTKASATGYKPLRRGHGLLLLVDALTTEIVESPDMARSIAGERKMATIDSSQSPDTPKDPNLCELLCEFRLLLLLPLLLLVSAIDSAMRKHPFALSCLLTSVLLSCKDGVAG